MQNNLAISLLTWFFLILPADEIIAQDKSFPIYFISDCQLPLFLEKIVLTPYKNKKGRDSLFKDIKRETQGTVFMLGDIVGMSSDIGLWSDVDSFLKNLRSKGTSVYAIPGNHEYLLNATSGIDNYLNRFPELPLNGYSVRTDSLAIVLLNSNFRDLSALQNNRQQHWYLAIMDSLDADASVKAVIVCAHHSPYSNSKVVGSSTAVQSSFVPRFESSKKAKLFISGHSHNLEYFTGMNNKHYLVIGGGGGIAQPLYTGESAKYKDLIKQGDKPLFFYIVLKRSGEEIDISIRGYSRALEHITEIKISM